MKLEHITYKGPEIEDEEILSLLPGNLAALLKGINGFVQYHGGFHLFGACHEPEWHSIRCLWQGHSAAFRHYEDIKDTDVPFAEDCLGFQFFLRDGNVISMDGETGEIEQTDMGLADFFEWIAKSPVENLGMQPLHQFMDEGGVCEPGELIAEYPFFCTEQAANGVTLSKVPALERRSFLVSLYGQFNALDDDQEFDVKLV